MRSYPMTINNKANAKLSQFVQSCTIISSIIRQESKMIITVNNILEHETIDEINKGGGYYKINFNVSRLASE
jgi:uncharacterized protein (UPF0262 family)